MDMGRELVDFLEQEAPESATAVLHSLVAIVILATINPMLALSAVAAFLGMIVIYGFAHKRFVSLNKMLNSQQEKQVGILATRSSPRLGAHLLSLRRAEVRVSDTEGVVYGLIFTLLLGAVLFNLVYATQSMVVTAGLVFSIVAYSWDFVESALALPMTLQSLARLSEIVARINQNEASA
jgi:ABC-type bacteriocin/lantibiotic exporter with double-glycine peptidase domain